MTAKKVILRMNEAKTGLKKTTSANTETIELPATLTPKAVAFFNYIADHPYVLSALRDPRKGLKYVCEAAGVDRTSFYDWMRQPAFWDAWSSLAGYKLKLAAPLIVADVIKFSGLAHNHQDRKLALEAAGVVRSGIQAAVGVKIDLSQYEGPIDFSGTRD